ncbi:restriction endonuclease subunit S, partial [Vibrio metschnikovii]|nr:restriction endonuclease subunit S [Vibrio metschnikovii]
MSCDIRAMWEQVGGKAPKHWGFTTLEKLLESPKSVSVGVMYPGQDTVGGVPLIKVSDVKNGAILGRPDFCISTEVDEEYKRTRLNGTELLITLVGNPGDCALVTNEMKGWNAARALAVVRLREPELREWLRYVLLSKPAKHLIDARLNTTVQKTLNLKDVKELPIPLPPIDERLLITKNIRDIEGKANLNTQTNQTLEQMAQAIFKSWFVDFDPVKAKMNGEQPEGMDEATASLFPEKLVESELGLIPEGWEASCMGEHFNITMGQSPKGETYNEDGKGIAFFQGRRDFGFRYPDVRVFTTDPKRYAKAGDTLISVRAPVGDKNMAAIDCCIGRGVAAIKHKSQSRSFTYAFVSHIEKKLGDSGSSGTVFSSINQNELKKVSFVAPPQELIEAFHKLVDPIDQKIEVLSEEIKSLSALRDT